MDNGFLQSPFACLIAKGLTAVADKHNIMYGQESALAWGDVGTAYLGHVLCQYPIGSLRQIQHWTREQYGPIQLDCTWYNELVGECLGDTGSVQAILPGQEGVLTLCNVNKELFMEMLDFFREG